MNMNETVIIPVIMSLVELLKGLGLPKRFSALAAVIAGAVFGLVFIDPQCARIGLFKGIIYGLTASGLYSSTKNTYQQVKSNSEKDKK